MNTTTGPASHFCAACRLSVLFGLGVAASCGEPGRGITGGDDGPNGNGSEPAAAIVYVSRPSSVAPSHLLSMDPAGSRQAPFTVDASCPDFPGVDDGAVNPRWSPDGQRVLFTERNGGGIYVIDRDGTDCRLIVDLDVVDRASLGAAWSPDGSRIAFCWEVPPFDTGLSVMNADGSQQEVLVTFDDRGVDGESLAPDCGIDWSPNGELLAFPLRPSFEGNRIRFWSFPDQSILFAPAIDDISGNTSSPAWSPDGSRLALSAIVTVNNALEDQIAIFDFSVGSAQAVGPVIDRIDHVRWSPDGASLVFTAEDGPWDDVWILSLADGGAVNLTSSTFDEGDADWR